MKRKLLPALLAAALLFSFAPTALANEEEGGSWPVTSQPLIWAEYEDVSPFSGGFAAVKSGGRWGYIDERGSALTPFIYDYAGPFSDGCALVAKRERMSDPYVWWDNSAPVEDMMVFYLLSENGRETRLAYTESSTGRVFPAFSRADGFNSADLALCRADGGAIAVRGRVFTSEGREIRPSAETVKAVVDAAYARKFWWVSETSDCAASTSLVVDGKIMMELRGDLPDSPGVFFLMDTDGRLIREYSALSTRDYLYGSDMFYVSALYPPEGGLIAARVTSVGAGGAATHLYGIMDVDGKWVIEPKYTDFRYLDGGGLFSNGLWVARNRAGKYGALDKNGATVIPFTYDSLTAFSDGYAAAEKSGEFFYLSTANERVGVGLPGGGRAVGHMTGSHISHDTALVADLDTGLSWLVSDTPSGGVLPAVSDYGSIAPEVYISRAGVPGFAGGLSDIAAVKGSGGRYGFDQLTFDLSQSNAFHDVRTNDFYYGALLWAVEQGILDTSAGWFRPAEASTRAQVVECLWKAAGSPRPSGSPLPFTDIPAGAEYRDAVLWACEAGVTRGISADTFGPEEPVSRGQVVTFLHRASHTPASSAANPFTDVPGGQFYTAAVLWAVENSVTTGITPTAFSPNSDVTNAELVTFLQRWAANR